MKKYFVHKKALVESKKIGEGTRIWAFAHILPGAKIGKNANICDHVFIENQVVLGDNVTIKNGVNIFDGVTLEDNVFIGSEVSFINDRYPRSKNTNFKLEKILIKKGATVGAGAVILGGVIIGKYALVGAGSVVTKDIPAFSLAYGQPAKVQAHICICTKKITFKDSKSKCKCGRVYKLSNSKVRLTLLK